MPVQSIEIVTPLGGAVANLFSRAQPLLQGQPPGSMKVFIFGGCAVHLLTNARVSIDIDAEIEVPMAISKEDVLASFVPPEGYEDVTGRDFQVYLDRNYTSALGPLHEDYRDRAIPLSGFSGDQPLHIFVAAPVDVAISKLGRFTDNDQADIERLIDLGLLDVNLFVALATEAIGYAVGNQSGMLSCLSAVTAKYLEHEGYASPEP